MGRILAFSVVSFLAWASTGCCSPRSTAVPLVTEIKFPSNPSGIVPVELKLMHSLTHRTNVLLEFSYDGQTWLPATLAPGEVATNLPTSSEGHLSTILWDSVTDLGFRSTPTAKLRATPTAAGAIGPHTSTSIPQLDNLKAAADRVTSHLAHFGPLDEETVLLAQSHDLVIVHALHAETQPATIKRIQEGVDPIDPRDDVIVLAYISVGEDLRTVALTDEEMLLDSRFIGDASGPRIDPRDDRTSARSLLNVDPSGLPTNSPSGTRFASFHLDDNSVENAPDGIGDGLPDRNSVFGGCFVNAGDPSWFTVLDHMTMDGVDRLPGMKELLTEDFGRGFACDGLFLDTFDTCAPNSYSNSESPNQSNFEWTAPGFRDFCDRVKQAYPKKLILQNRGLFFFDPRLPHYKVTTRSSIDLMLFESYRLDSSATQEFDPFFALDNKYNYAPKLMAEAGRPDGFKVLSLGYAEGPGIDRHALLGQSTEGLDTLLADIEEAQHLAGFIHYLTDANLTLPNSFAQDNVVDDMTPPVWSSTYNANAYPFPSRPPTPRVGIQRLVCGKKHVSVQWDVALDQSGVGYALYIQENEFDFKNDPTLSNAQRLVLTPEIGTGYEEVDGASVYPYEASVSVPNDYSNYHLCLRAFDRLGHEENNEVVFTCHVDPEGEESSLSPIEVEQPSDTEERTISNFKKIAGKQVEKLSRHLSNLLPSSQAATQSEKVHVALLGNRFRGSSVVFHSTCAHTNPSNTVFHVILDDAEGFTSYFEKLSACKGAQLEIKTINETLEELTELGYSLKWTSNEVEGKWGYKTPYTDTKHSDPLNLLRFYLPHLSSFSGIDRIVFLDDDIIVQKDISLLNAFVLGTDSVMAAGCQHWIWSPTAPGGFKSTTYLNFRDTGYVGNFDTICDDDAEKGPCVTADYFDKLVNASEKINGHSFGFGGNPLGHQAFNMGFNVLETANWKRLQVTERFEQWVDAAFEDRLFAPDTLAFGLGLAYLTLGGDVKCYDTDIVHLVGLAFISQPSMEAEGWTTEKIHNEVFALHYNGANKPWDAPIPECGSEELQTIRTHPDNALQIWQQACIDSSICACQQPEIVPDTSSNASRKLAKKKNIFRAKKSSNGDDEGDKDTGNEYDEESDSSPESESSFDSEPDNGFDEDPEPTQKAPKATKQDKKPSDEADDGNQFPSTGDIIQVGAEAEDNEYAYPKPATKNKNNRRTTECIMERSQ